MVMLPCKLLLIVIAAHDGCIVNRQIGVEEFKYGVIDDSYLRVMEGHVTYF